MRTPGFSETEIVYAVKEQDPYRPVPFGLEGTALYKASSLPCSGQASNFHRA